MSSKTSNSKQNVKKTNNNTGKRTTAERKRAAEAAAARSRQNRALIFMAFAVLMVFVVAVPGEKFWRGIHNLSGWLMGWGAFLLPVLFVYLSVTTAMNKRRMNGKFALTTLIVITFSAVFNLFAGLTGGTFKAFLGTITTISDAGFSIKGMGLMGNLLAYPLESLFGLSGAKIFSVILLVLLIMLLTGVTVLKMMSAAQKPVEKIKVANVERRRRAEERRTFEQENRRNNFEERSIDIPLDGESRAESTNDKAERLKKAVQKVNGVTPKPPVAADNEFPSDDYIMQASKIARDIQSENDAKNKATSKTEKDVIVDTKNQPEKFDDISVPTSVEPEPLPVQNVPVDMYKTPNIDRKAKKGETQEFSREIAEEIRKNEMNGEKPHTHEYKFPPMELLVPPKETDNTGVMAELQENGKKLIETLASFNVRARIVNICRGPSVTRYEIQPAPGVKISKITNLSDDIALNLAAEGVRIEAPIPGKAAVGIEIPNKTVSMVSMRELVDSDKFESGKSKLTCVLGRDISGNIVTIDLAKLPHLLIAGTTGSGKSVCVNSILISILYKATPDEVKLILIDPKMVEFSKYNSIPHLLIPVVSDPKKAAGALNWAVNEMLERYRSFSECGARDIHSYNKLVDENLKKIEAAGEDDEEVKSLTPVKRMEQIVIAIDELADLMMAAAKEVEDSIFRLAQMARAAGMHLVIATQRPSVDVITGVIKANIPSRIALKVSSQTDSRTILDSGGAEKLIGRGDMLCMPVGTTKPVRVQGGYASDDEIEYITDFVRKQGQAEYNEEVIEKIEQITETALNSDKKSNDTGAGGLDDADSLTEDAIKCVVEAGEASVSLLQRKLKVGYARAGRLVDDLETMGIVGPHEGSKKRKVLMTYQQWLERANLNSN